DVVRVVAELVRPFMPATGERALGMLGVQPAPDSWRRLAGGALTPGTRLGHIGPLFPRIEQTVEELQQMANEDTPAPTPTPAPAGTDRISIDDFMKVELRTARVLAAERVPKSNKLLKLQVDTGGDQRTIVAGIAEAYEPDTLVGRTVV